MATISKERDGRRRIQFFDRDGKRRSIGLGKVPQRIAESWRSHVTLLNQSVTHGQPAPDDTVTWLTKLGDKQSAKLAKVGLIPARQRALLGPFIDQYIAGRKDVKSGTLIVLGQTRRNLVDYFGPDKPLREISPGDADDWHRWMLTDEKLAENTARRRCGIAKQFCRAAQRKRLILENPFADLQSSVRGNRSRDFFVTREMADKVLAACPSLAWQLIFALSRYGALRCPSEHSALTWGDVDFARSRMYVRSSKTERHDGGEGRWVPIFIELRSYLDMAFAEAETREDWSLRPDRPMSAEPIIRVPSGTKVNWRTQLARIVRAAGLQPWPKFF